MYTHVYVYTEGIKCTLHTVNRRYVYNRKLVYAWGRCLREERKKEGELKKKKKKKKKKNQ